MSLRRAICLMALIMATALVGADHLDSLPADVERWRPLAASIFPADTVDGVLAVMACESGGDPDLVNDSGEFSVGLMQINTETGRHGWLNGWGNQAHSLKANVHGLHDWQSLQDPWLNLNAAHFISQGGTDWSHWTCQP